MSARGAPRRGHLAPPNRRRRPGARAGAVTGRGPTARAAGAFGALRRRASPYSPPCCRLAIVLLHKGSSCHGRGSRQPHCRRAASSQAHPRHCCIAGGPRQPAAHGPFALRAPPPFAAARTAPLAGRTMAASALRRRRLPRPASPAVVLAPAARHPLDRPVAWCPSPVLCRSGVVTSRLVALGLGLHTRRSAVRWRLVTGCHPGSFTVACGASKPAAGFLPSTFSLHIYDSETNRSTGARQTKPDCAGAAVPPSQTPWRGGGMLFLRYALLRWWQLRTARSCRRSQMMRSPSRSPKPSQRRRTSGEFVAYPMPQASRRPTARGRADGPGYELSDVAQVRALRAPASPSPPPPLNNSPTHWAAAASRCQTTTQRLLRRTMGLSLSRCGGRTGATGGRFAVDWAQSEAASPATPSGAARRAEACLQGRVRKRVRAPGPALASAGDAESTSARSSSADPPHLLGVPQQDARVHLIGERPAADRRRQGFRFLYTKGARLGAARGGRPAAAGGARGAQLAPAWQRTPRQPPAPGGSPLTPIPGRQCIIHTRTLPGPPSSPGQLPQRDGRAAAGPPGHHQGLCPVGPRKGQAQAQRQLHYNIVRAEPGMRACCSVVLCVCVWGGGAVWVCRAPHRRPRARVRPGRGS